MEDKKLEKDIATVESQRLAEQASKIAAMNNAMQNIARKANDEPEAEIIMTTTADRNPFASATEVKEAREEAATLQEAEAAEPKAETITQSTSHDPNWAINSELKPKILQQAPLSDEEDAKQNKKFTWLAYILFFIPLCINSESAFVRLHVNEGLEVFLIDIFAIAMLLCGTLIKWGQSVAIIGYLLILASIGLLILTTVTKIFQIVQVARGKKNQTPWFFKWRMIK